MKILTAILLLITISTQLFAQRMNATEAQALGRKEDSLKVYAEKIIQGINPSDRLLADSLFTKTFVRALKINHSFSYPFDSLNTISKLYAPDSSFRIYSWQMVINENVIRQHGAIQMRTKDGSLKLIPLIDKSDITIKQADTIANNMGWMGAVYYKIIQTKYLNHNYYTLLGFDENNIRSTKKIIEILDIINGEPKFGGRLFNINKPGFTNSIARYVMEYKKDASPRLTWDEDLNMIVMEHLISQSNEPNKKFTLVGDGDYEAFKWVNGKWSYLSKLYDQVTPEGKPPVPTPLNESKLNTGQDVKPAPKKTKN
ncbi:MAG: hypothetical protein ABIY51_09400 [Ferruginibacter sp.]